jgi:hypothetical protein
MDIPFRPPGEVGASRGVLIYFLARKTIRPGCLDHDGSPATTRCMNAGGATYPQNNKGRAIAVRRATVIRKVGY